MYDVAIVGCGPVGAVLGNLLGQLGVHTLVLEREALAYHLPRAVHFDDEVMRVFQAIGLADTIAELCHVSPGMRFVNAAGTVLVDWPRPPGLGPQGWHRSYRFHQPDLERVLRAGLSRFPNVELRARCEVTDIVQDAAAAHLAVTDLATGETATLAARYVVGCDGARSLVRRVIGTTLEDLHAHQQWLVTDLILDRPRPDLGDFSIQHCDPARPATYVRGTGLRRRWEIMLMPDDDPATATLPDTVWRWLAPWIGPSDAHIERATVYTFHAAIARTWRHGRLLLAGDAAHMTPPFLGQGMCAGLRDAANLAWKLARVLADRANPALLDSYASERSPHVREYIEIAVRLGAVIQETDPDRARARDARFAERPELMHSPAPRLGPGLHDDGVAPAGTLAPQPRLADGRLLDDAQGYRLAAVMSPCFAAIVSPVLRAALARHEVAIAEDAGADVAAWLKSVDAGCVLVRPDRYLLGTATTQDGLDALLRRLC